MTHETNKRLVERGRRVVLITCKPDNSLPDHEVIDGVEFDRILKWFLKILSGYGGLFAKG